MPARGSLDSRRPLFEREGDERLLGLLVRYITPAAGTWRPVWKETVNEADNVGTGTVI